METVLTLPQLRGEPIDADSGGRGRRAPPLSTIEPARVSFSTRKMARSVLDDQASSPLPGMRKWMRAHAGGSFLGAGQPGRSASARCLPHGARCMWPLSSGSCVLQPTPNWIVILELAFV